MEIIKGRIVTPQGDAPGAVVVENGRITAVRADAPALDHDFGDALVVPGFIDVHMHGVGPYGVYETPDILGAARLLPTFGAAGFVPSTASLPEPRFHLFARNVREARRQAAPQSARILGAHYEGPFINPQRRGGMDAGFLRPMDVAECRRYVEQSRGVLKLMTLSPELVGSEPVIRLLHESGVVVSAGHSLATAEDLRRAVAAGLGHVCHLYNTFMRPAEIEADARAPDLVVGALAACGLNCEVICDMRHVRPEYVKLAIRALGPDRFIAVTDGMTGAGLPPGEYPMVDGRRYTTDEGVGRLKDTGETVGSVLTMNKAFANLVERCGATPAEAARYTSANPARAMGIGDDTGSIEKGKRADLAVLDADYNCVAAFIAGELVHRG